MARIDSGSVTVSSSGTAVQITTSIAANARVRDTDKIITLAIKPRYTNSGAAMYFGTSNVTTSYGTQIPRGTTEMITLEGTLGGKEGVGRDDFDAFYVDADTSGDIADWIVVW